jgi:hypothetical protein
MSELDAILLALAILGLGFWLTRDKTPEDKRDERRYDDSDYPDGGHW